MILCPGAEYGPAKQWPAEHFAAVACSWLSESEHHGVKIIGGPKDQSIAAEIESKIRAANTKSPEPGLASRVLNQAGRTSLLEAFGEIAKASLVISNDSGLMHAAAAFDVPVIGIYGSTDPKHTPPLSAKAQVATLELSCSPCFQRVCPLGTTACLRDLQPSQITTMIRNIPLASPS
jgi:heptosyltransferase-2